MGDRAMGVGSNGPGGVAALLACLVVATGCGRVFNPSVSTDEPGPAGRKGAGTPGAGSAASAGRGGGSGAAGAGGAGPVAGSSAMGGSSGEAGDGAGTGPSQGGTDAALDGEHVYIWGTLSEGASYRDAVADPLMPNVALVGFEGHSWHREIRSSDGALVYSASDNTLREFRCDGACRLTQGNRTSYPNAPQANDPVVPAAGCLDDRTNGFHFSPDGTQYHRCYGSDNRWRDAEGEVVFPVEPDEIEAVNDYGLFLTSRRGSFAIRDTTNPEMPPRVVDAPPGREYHSARAVQDGFLLSFRSPTSDDHPELWHLDFDGTLSDLGSYPPPPLGFSGAGGFLDGQGRLWHEGRGPATFQDVVIRRTLGQDEAEVVYDEASDPLVKMHISYLFTGNGGGRFSPSADAPDAERGLEDTRTGTDQLDPNRIYSLGMLRKGAGRALFDPAEPQVAVTGFNANIGNLRVHPDSGRLFYIADDNTIREFHCDGWCQHIAYEPYPQGTLRNDPAQPAEPCLDGKARAFEFSPDGSQYHSCLFEEAWRNAAGDTLYVPATGESVRSVHDGGLLLLSRETGYAVVDPSTSTTTSIDGTPIETELFASRAVEGGWLLVFQSTASDRTATLWRVGHDAALQRLATYPPAPAGAAFDGAGAMLDGSGRLWETGRDADRANLLIRRDPDASTADIVLRGADETMVALGSLFSGSGGSGP